MNRMPIVTARLAANACVTASALLQLALIAAVAMASEAQPQASAGPARTWNFDDDAAGAPPRGFSFGRTGDGRPGRWIVRAETDAPGAPNVLAQLEDDATDYRFPVAVADEPLLRDLRLSVRCKPVSGHVDQACGLVFRYRDEKNYYVARANALEDNVVLFHVVDGRRRPFASFKGKVASGVWHELRVEARGDHLEVFFNGTRVIDAHDRTFMEAGRVGLWTKADSVTDFDDLSVSDR